MNRATWAKFSGWAGGILVAVGTQGALGPRWSPIAVSVGAALLAGGVHAGAGTDGTR